MYAILSSASKGNTIYGRRCSKCIKLKNVVMPIDIAILNLDCIFSASSINVLYYFIKQRQCQECLRFVSAHKNLQNGTQFMELYVTDKLQHNLPPLSIINVLESQIFICSMKSTVSKFPELHIYCDLCGFRSWESILHI